MYKESKVQKEEIDEEEIQKEAEKKKKRLIDNAAPTDGSRGRASSQSEKTANESFLDAFNK